MSTSEVTQVEASPRISEKSLPQNYELDPASKDLEISAPAPVSAPQLDIPDGGIEAWTVVFGGFLSYFATFGVVNSYVSTHC